MVLLNTPSLVYVLIYVYSPLVVCLLMQSSQSYSLVFKTVRSPTDPYNSDYTLILVQADHQARVATNHSTCTECGNTPECGAKRVA